MLVQLSFFLFVSKLFTDGSIKSLKLLSMECQWPKMSGEPEHLSTKVKCTVLLGIGQYLTHFDNIHQYTVKLDKLG